MSSAFTKMIKGEISAHKVWEDNKIMAILDHKPVNAGHMLVIPHEEIEDIFDLNEKRYEELWRVVKKLYRPLKIATGAPKIAIVVEGFAVPHIHIHMVPVYRSSELTPQNSKFATKEELDSMLIKIKKQITIQEKNSHLNQ